MQVFNILVMECCYLKEVFNASNQWSKKEYKKLQSNSLQNICKHILNTSTPTTLINLRFFIDNFFYVSA